VVFFVSMSEQFRNPETDNKNRSKNLGKFLLQGWQILKRRDQLGQISYVNLRLRRDYSNCAGNVTRIGDYAIYAEKLESGGGLRKVEYARRDEQGQPSMRRVTIMNQENHKRAWDIEHIIVDDIPLDGGDTQTQSFDVAAGLRSQLDFPLAELEKELTDVYKAAKPHIWPGDPLWL
jgi:hypothetical protein